MPAAVLRKRHVLEPKKRRVKERPRSGACAQSRKLGYERNRKRANGRKRKLAYARTRKRARQKVKPVCVHSRRNDGPLKKKLKRRQMLKYRRKFNHNGSQ